ncbi:MAG: WYL domain-containing protein, partial [Bacteroidales bacterium]|nr:WYL domain-containing protein [Bacteroidales bacterium]
MKSTAINRYIWLLDTISSAGTEGITFAEIARKWEKYAIAEKLKKTKYPKRTFDNHKDDILKIFKIDINCNKRTNSYFINKNDINSDTTTKWIVDSYTVGMTLSDNSLTTRIALEEIPEKKYLTDIIKAIKENRKINFKYQKFEDVPEDKNKMIPYGIKVFERRWYLMAKKGSVGKAKDIYNDNDIHAYPFDRILSLELTDEQFKLPKDFDINDLFLRVYGLMREDNWWKKSQLIKIKANSRARGYFRTLRLHTSQKEIETNKDYSIFELYLSPANDFRIKLLTFMDQIEVLEPKSLRNEM